MGVFLPWMVTMAFQVGRDIKVCGKMPVPSEFVAAGGAFAALSLLSQAQPQLAKVLAWGILVGVYLKVFPGSDPAGSGGGQPPHKPHGKTGVGPGGPKQRLGG